MTLARNASFIPIGLGPCPCGDTTHNERQSARRHVSWRLLGVWLLATGMAGMHALEASAQQAFAQLDTAPATSGPIRLRQPVQADSKPGNEPLRREDMPATAERAAPLVSTPSEFERYVRRVTGDEGLRRYGHDLVTRLQAMDDRQDASSALVPPEYVVRPGDELLVTLWGSVDADLRLQVDRTGRITIPRVGPVMVAGTRYAELGDAITRRVGQVFKGFQVSVALGQIRAIRVYVTGFVNQPGPVLVGGLSTLTQALLSAGGPAAGGSFRDVQLRRGKQVASRMDLYDLLLRGDRSADQTLQADDVIHVGPIGPQVAMVGSVNRQAIFETRSGETVDEVLRMGGGFSAVADASRITLERLGEGNRLTQIGIAGAAQTVLRNGDIVRALNAGDVLGPMGAQQKRVRVEGEVARPGEYVLPAASTVADAIRASGGVTPAGYLYATEFTRESVRIKQQINYDRALRDFETLVTSSSVTRRASSAEEVAAQSASAVASSRLLGQLRELKPTGRIVLSVGASTTDVAQLPDLALEDGDRLYVPSRPVIVGVFGSVFSTGSYLHAPNRTVDDYLRLAGGPTRGADGASVFVVRANGSVISSLQRSTLFSRGNQIAGVNIDPGDTIFVPEDTDKATWMQNAKDWTQILYQFGIGIAGIKSAFN